MSGRENLYIHVYIDPVEAVAAYEAPREEIPFGKALLDFVYSDLNAVTKNHDKEGLILELLKLHPFFRHIPKASLGLFFENSGNSDYKGSFCMRELLKLQEKYGRWLQTYVREGLSWRFLENFGKYGFYGQVRYVMLSGKAVEDYFLLGFEDCLYLDLLWLIRQRILLKTCKNCGRIFVPLKSNVDYCPRIYTKDGKTCQDVGYTKTFARSVKSDELLQAYTRAYKAHYARMSKPRKKAGNLSREDFESWYREAKDKLEQARRGIIDPQTYKDWLKK